MMIRLRTKINFEVTVTSAAALFSWVDSLNYTLIVSVYLPLCHSLISTLRRDAMYSYKRQYPIPVRTLSEPRICASPLPNVICVWLLGTFLRWGITAPQPTSKLNDHLLSTLRNCLFNTLTHAQRTWTLFLHLQIEFAPCHRDRAELVARMGERRGAYRVLVGKPGGKSHLEDVGIDGSIILKWIIKKWNGWRGLH